MFEISFFAAEAAFTAIWLLVRISIWIRQKSIDWKREAVLALMYINLAVIIRFGAAYCIQAAEQFMESSRSRRVYFTMH